MRIRYRNSISSVDVATDECREEAVPFLCLYHFSLCSCHEQQLVLPTKEECVRISTTTCKVELQLALSFGFGYLLPDCDELPSSIPSSREPLTYRIINMNCLPINNPG